MAQVTFIASKDTYMVIYTDIAKTIFLQQLFVSLGSVTTFKDGQAYNDYDSLALFNSEMSSLGEPQVATDPFLAQPDPV
tara:strand:+ start:1839 stop:2075 length:237 start_codon:yes stop_codon:yes gene_type:complete